MRPYQVFAVLALGCVSPVLAAYPAASVCELRVQMPGRYEQGSGTLIGVAGDKGLVLTAGHVPESVGRHLRVMWRMAGVEESDGVCVAVTDTNADLALIVCPRPRGLRPVPIVPFDESKSPWTSMGFRDSKFWTVDATHCDYKGGRMYLNGTYKHGMSGGPTFDRDGNLVGVVSAIDNANEDEATLGMSGDGPKLQELINQFRK